MRPKDITTTSVFAFLYFILGFWGLPLLGDPLIPLSILFGWPVIIGVTIGSSILAILYIGFEFHSLVWIIAVFLASLTAWRIGTSKLRIKVNVLAILGVIIAFVSLFFPWWFFNISLFNRLVFDFRVYPGWFGGDLGTWINAIRGIGQWTGIDPFASVLDNLQFTVYLLGLGALIAAVGAFLRGLLGRIIVGIGFASYTIGVVNFYLAWNGLLKSITVSASGFRKIEWAGTRVAEASWDWSWGIYLAIFVCLILFLGFLLHPNMPQIEISHFVACVAATITNAVIFSIAGSLSTRFPMEYILLNVYGMRLLTSTILVGISGYLLVKCLSIARVKRKKEQEVFPLSS